MGEEHRGTSFEHALLQCLRAQRSALHKGPMPGCSKFNRVRDIPRF